MQRNQVTIKMLTLHEMPRLWEISCSEKKPLWSVYNAPYFREYKQHSLESFLKKEMKYYIDSPQNMGIFYDDLLVGNISYYWEHEASRWLEFGIVIYDEAYWNKNIGFDASTLWIEYMFNTFPEIARVGCTSWSGNPAMMRLAGKLGMQQEARLRKVRFWDGVYYDSLRYGLLRTEWQQQTSAALPIK